MSKSLLTHLGEALDAYRAERRMASLSKESPRRERWPRWLPHPAHLVITLLLILALFWAQSAGALPGLASPQANVQSSQTTIPYQGRLADADGNPVTDTVNMVFRLYGQASGGGPLWEEPWTGSNGVQVSDGLFNVMLGSLNPIPQDVITGHDNLFLGITAGTDDEMTPRVQLGSVPFAVQALTIPDGSVTTEKIADGAVTQVKLGADVSMVPPDGSVTTEKIADGAVTQSKAPTLVKSGNGSNEIIRSGNVVFHGTDSDGFVTVEYPCFPHGVRVFLAFNGHWNANHIWPVGHNGGGQCSTQVKMSSSTGNAFRLNWIAIGN